MTKRSKFDRIPADEVQEPKPWHLPYWVEPPHLVQQEEEDVLVEEEEIEVEPLTAEQLEQIRQEAYNEGLEQGLVEGRQKGERLGYEAGHQEGRDAGYKEGFAQGQEEGKEKGEATALAEGKAKTDQKVAELNALLRELYSPIEEERAQLDALLPELVLKLVEQIIEAELSQGSEHAISYVRQALDALPTGAKNIEIYISPLDLPYVEAAIEQESHWRNDWVIKEDEDLQAGGCRIQSHESIVDFTREKRWQNLLEQFLENYKLGELKADAGELPDYDEFTELDETNPTEVNALNEEIDQGEEIDQNKDIDLDAEPLTNESANQADEEGALGSNELDDPSESDELTTDSEEDDNVSQSSEPTENTSAQADEASISQEESLLHEQQPDQPVDQTSNPPSEIESEVEPDSESIKNHPDSELPE